jgi:hypothetical protein
VTALAVVLHETLHATGAQAPGDVRGRRSGRAFEEGFTEAATVALLPRFIASLDQPAALEARLLAAAGRYRPAYPRIVAWARGLAVEATGRGAASRRAKGWLVRVADRWGTDRWRRLAAATAQDEATLRADAWRSGIVTEPEPR